MKSGEWGLESDESVLCGENVCGESVCVDYM